MLDEILLRLATYIEKADALKRKVQSAMVYPAVVLTVAIGATAFMLIFIIPTFAKMFTRLRRRAAAADQDRAGALGSCWFTGGGRWSSARSAVGFALQRYYADRGRTARDRPVSCSASRCSATCC